MPISAPPKARPRVRPVTPRSDSPPTPAPDSLEEVIHAFHELRGCLAELLLDVRADPTKTRESARVLGLNRGLVWRLTRVVRSADIASAVSSVPARASVDRFIESCRERGAPAPKLDAVSAAMDRFEASVARCSGDRKTLAILMANAEGRTDSGEQERARRKLFDGACAVWGVQAHVRFVSAFLFPSPDSPDHLDIAHVTGYVGFRRLRGIPWPMRYGVVQSREGHAVDFRTHPLDPEGDPEVQLLSAFCDPPNPRIESVTIGDMKRFELAPGPVGNQGVCTCVFGTHLRRLYPRIASEAHTHASFTVMLETPVERVLFDLFVHRDIPVSGIPSAHVCDRLTHPHPPNDDEVDRLALPISTRPYALGPGAVGALSPHIPWYPRLVTDIAARIGHTPEDFSGSRFELAFPPIPTAVVRRFPLLPA